MGGCRIGGQVPGIARKHDAGLEKAFAQQARGDEGVATVVARAGENQDRHIAFQRQGRSPVRGGRAGSFHEGFAGVSGFDLAQPGAVVKVGVHREILSPNPAGEPQR